MDDGHCFVQSRFHRSFWQMLYLCNLRDGELLLVVEGEEQAERWRQGLQDGAKRDIRRYSNQ